MKFICRVSTSVFAVLFLLLPLSNSQAAITIDLNVSSQTNTPEAAVSLALAAFCNQIQTSPGANTQYLAQVCNAIETADQSETAAAYRALSARSATSITSMITRGPSSLPVPILDKRLAALRRAAANQSNANFDFDINGKPLPDDYVAELFPWVQQGGAAGADELGSRLSGFASASLINSEQTETSTLAGFDGATSGLVLGMDYRFSDKAYAGTAVRVAQSSVDLDLSEGSLDATDYNLTFYGSYYPRTNFYLDGTFNAGHGSYDLDRKIKFGLTTSTPPITVNQTANSSTNGNQIGASIGGGYEQVFGQGFVAQLISNFRYTTTTIDSYEENSANGLDLRISEQTIDSMMFKLGGTFTRAFSQKWGVIAPQLDIYWLHDFNPDGEKVEASFVADPFNTKFAFTTEDRDSDYFTVSAGAVVLFPGGFTAYLQYETYINYDNFDQNMISLGARMEF